MSNPNIEYHIKTVLLLSKCNIKISHVINLLHLYNGLTIGYKGYHAYRRYMGWGRILFRRFFSEIFKLDFLRNFSDFCELMYNLHMSRNILIFGDSNIHYFTFFYEENGKKPEPKGTPIEHIKTVRLLDDNVTCMWRYSSSGIKINHHYLYIKLKQYRINIYNYSHMVFQFGNNDIRGHMEDPSQIPYLVKKYVDLASDFCIKNNLVPVFTTPIVHKNLVDLELLNSYIKELKRYCEEKGIIVIDVYDVIDNDFKSYEWDAWLHLEEHGAKAVLEHILKNIP